MGREIRKVTKGWEHPKDKHGDYKPMFDEDYDTAAQGWIKGLFEWENATDPDISATRKEAEEEYKCRYYWAWVGGPPNKKHHRPKFKEEPTCYQIYENVSKGTPISPVFETEDEMFKWLVKQGYPQKAAKKFIKNKSLVSGVFFADKNGMIEWLVEEGYSRESAEKYAEENFGVSPGIAIHHPIIDSES